MQQTPKFDQLQGPFSARIEVNGQSYLYFGGTAYLGIPQHQAFIAHYLEGIKRFGLNNGTSRSNNVQLNIYNEAERFAAHRFGAAGAIFTSSGYLAAQMTIKHFSSYGTVRYAPATHPALWQENDPEVKGIFNEWAQQLVAEINNSRQTKWVIISNSMNNLFPECYDFSFVQQLDQNKQIVLIVDDSHGIGINNNGLGAYGKIKQGKNVAVIVVASMAKALGVDAGLILGPEEIIAQLKQTEMFLGASPPAAAGLFAFMQANEIYAAARHQLKANMELLAAALKDKEDWHFIEGFPVFFSKNVELSSKLQQQKILVSAFPYPDQNGPIINRVVLSSWHDEAAIRELIHAI